MGDPEFSHPFEVAGLAGRQQLSLTAGPAVCAALAGRFEVAAIAGVTAELVLTRGVAGGVNVSGRLRARITQTCVVSGEDFEVSIDETIDEVFHDGADAVADALDLDPDAALAEPVVDGIIDLGEMTAQLLGLAIDPYARAPQARSQTETVDHAPPENDARHSPFAGLADRLRGGA
ncbi:MAG: YceD family protein [Thalassobaculaceae bacterium]